MFSYARLCQTDFLKYSGRVETGGRNRPLLAIQARYGLSGTSVSRNCWIFGRNIKKISFSYAGHKRTFCSLCFRKFIRTPFDTQKCNREV